MVIHIKLIPMLMIGILILTVVMLVPMMVFLIVVMVSDSCGTCRHAAGDNTSNDDSEAYEIII